MIFELILKECEEASLIDILEEKEFQAKGLMSIVALRWKLAVLCKNHNEGKVAREKEGREQKRQGGVGVSGGWCLCVCGGGGGVGVCVCARARANRI